MEYIKPLFSESQINEKVGDIAFKMNQEFAKKSDIVIVSILNGSFIFAADLIRKLNFDFEFDLLRISSYRNSTVSGKIDIQGDLNIDVKNKHVIILEDILDTGNTVTAACNFLIQKGASMVDVSAIVVKSQKYSIPIPVRYPGLIIEDIFVVGYGLDNAGRYRNLPYIGIFSADNE